MCNFFSFKTDGNQKIFCFSGQQRRDKVTYPDGQDIANYDSHTAIEAYYGLKDTDWSSGEYNPFTDQLVIDQQHTTWDDEKVRGMLDNIDWNDLCGDVEGARKFIADLKTIPWFKPDGTLQDSDKIKVFETRDAARAAARDAARDAAWDAAWAAARAAARDAAWAAARAAAWDAAWDVARDAAWDVARDAAWDAAWAAARATTMDAQNYCSIHFVCKGLKIGKKHIAHVDARFEVWKRGYGVLCDANGVLYCYKGIR